jgi:hypothetical protein
MSVRLREPIPVAFTRRSVAGKSVRTDEMEV